MTVSRVAKLTASLQGKEARRRESLFQGRHWEELTTPLQTGRPKELTTP